MPENPIGRREFVLRSFGAVGMIAASGALPRSAIGAEAPGPGVPDAAYTGDQLEQIAFPMGGFGTGMICLGGSGALTHVSLRDRPFMRNQPGLFAAIAVRGPRTVARVIEGPVPRATLFALPHACNGTAPAATGFPRYAGATFRGHFPFARIDLADPAIPFATRVTGWSPFVPGDADSSSLPVAALEYTFTHTGDEELDAVFSFSTRNFLADAAGGREAARSTRPIPGGFIFHGAASREAGEEEAWLAAEVDEPGARVDLAWFRGDGSDPVAMAWRDIELGWPVDRPVPSEGEAPSGATLFVPFHILPGESRTIRLRLSWYSPLSQLREIAPDPAEPYRPWYADRFASIDAVAGHWRQHYADLRRRSERFSLCFFDSTLPAEATEAAAANLSILKSPTVLRQADGRLWGWEGCDEDRGEGPGSCTPVWNYAQSIAHLFPALERTLRETEFTVSQDDRGHQNFRVALPIQPTAHAGPASADGQLGGILKAHREWRICGDAGWLRTLWPRIRQSLDYCIATWDPGRRGWLDEPRPNTLGATFWGPDALGTSFYIGALQAAAAMGRFLGEPVAAYEELAARGAALAHEQLYNGEYFYQRPAREGAWSDPARLEPGRTVSREEAEILVKEGPRHQVGTGCLSSALSGSWLALACGVGQVLDPEKVRSHLLAVHRHNFARDLSTQPNPARATFANGREGGLLQCTWPRGRLPTLPLPCASEVWTGTEYQAAAHMITMGLVAEGLEIVRACRARYDGRVRNPYDEYEGGHWYARAMASYGLLQALSGARYDAVEKVLHLQPAVRGDFRCFLSTASGYGTVGVADGKPFLTVVSGVIPLAEIRFTAAPGAVA